MDNIDKYIRKGKWQGHDIVECTICGYSLMAGPKIEAAVRNHVMLRHAEIIKKREEEVIEDGENGIDED